VVGRVLRTLIAVCDIGFVPEVARVSGWELFVPFPETLMKVFSCEFSSRRSHQNHDPVVPPRAVWGFSFQALSAP
jgi:hypothetical protein